MIAKTYSNFSNIGCTFNSYEKTPKKFSNISRSKFQAVFLSLYASSRSSEDNMKERATSGRSESRELAH